MTIKGFMTYHDQGNSILKLSDEDAGKLYKAEILYSMTGEIPCFEDLVMQIVWDMLRRSIDVNAETYAKTCLRNSYNSYIAKLKRTGNENSKLCFEDWYETIYCTDRTPMDTDRTPMDTDGYPNLNTNLNTNLNQNLNTNLNQNLNPSQNKVINQTEEDCKGETSVFHGILGFEHTGNVDNPSRLEILYRKKQELQDQLRTVIRLDNAQQEIVLRQQIDEINLQIAKEQKKNE